MSSHSPKRSCSRVEGPSGLDIYHTGPALSAGPMAALIYFALAGDESLTVDPFCQPVVAAPASFRCFSFTLPFHESADARTHAMHEWKKGLQEGDSWLEAFLQQCVENVDFLIDSGAIDPLRLAAGGLSRGAYIATHLASRCPAIQSLLGYAPLTRLAALDGPDNRPAALAQWDLERLVPQLLGRKVLFTIGNCDTRVGIGHCYEFIKLLADANFAAGTRSPPVELYIHPSIGHRGHGTPPEVFLKGVEWLTAACALP